MLLNLIKIILAGTLFLIGYQDIRDRAVWWFLFPLFLVCAGLLNYTQSIWPLFIMNSGMNILLTTLMFGISYLYAEYKMRIGFLKSAIGIGDLCFYGAMTLAFPTAPYLTLLVFSLLFSLAIHLFLSDKKSTVPLAGYASLFILIIYGCNWIGLCHNLYLN